MFFFFTTPTYTTTVLTLRRKGLPWRLPGTVASIALLSGALQLLIGRADAQNVVWLGTRSTWSCTQAHLLTLQPVQIIHWQDTDARWCFYTSVGLRH